MISTEAIMEILALFINIYLTTVCKNTDFLPISLLFNVVLCKNRSSKSYFNHLRVQNDSNKEEVKPVDGMKFNIKSFFIEYFSKTAVFSTRKSYNSLRISIRTAFLGDVRLQNHPGIALNDTRLAHYSKA